MIQGDERGRFGHPITLNHRIAEAMPKRFDRLGQGGASRNEGPEFPSEQVMDASKTPPASQKMLPFSGRKVFSEPLGPAMRLQPALYFPLKPLNHPRDCHQYRH